jgi:hypothetical protein
VKRLLDPYGSLGPILNRVQGVAILYLIEAIGITWALVALQWTAAIVLLVLACGTMIWEGILPSKLRIPAKRGMFLWSRFIWSFLGLAQYYFLRWFTHLSDQAHQGHDPVAAALLKRFTHNWPWFEALILAIYSTILATAFVVKWRKASKAVFERPPVDPVVEQMARELDDWLTNPKTAIQ